MANLIIWRHAEAEAQSESGHDRDRVLTKRGRKDAGRIAKWLYKHLPEHTELLCSPARRCLQTADALHDLNQMEIKIADCLSLDSHVGRMIQEVDNQDDTQTIILVGHQPNLGLFIAKLLGLHQSACVVKKGAVWWLKQRKLDGVSHYYIEAVKQPGF